MQSDPTDVFRFIWENKAALGIERNAFTRVTSVRPVVRVSNDQCILRETVVEYVQQLNVYSNELSALGIEFCFAEMKDPVKDKLKRFGLFKRFGEKSFFATVGEAVRLANDSPYGFERDRFLG